MLDDIMSLQKLQESKAELDSLIESKYFVLFNSNSIEEVRKLQTELDVLIKIQLIMSVSVVKEQLKQDKA